MNCIIPRHDNIYNLLNKGGKFFSKHEKIHLNKIYRRFTQIYRNFRHIYNTVYFCFQSTWCNLYGILRIYSITNFHNMNFHMLSSNYYLIKMTLKCNSNSFNPIDNFRNFTSCINFISNYTLNCHSKTLIYIYIPHLKTQNYYLISVLHVLKFK